MKMLYLIILGVLIIVVFFIACKNKNTSNVNEPKSQNDTIGSPTKENPYIGIRNMALKMTPQMLEISLPTDKTIVYGVIMDWGMDNYTTTITSFSGGAASIYLSNGGGFIGGETHPNVKAAAQVFVTNAQDFLANAKKTEATPLPQKDNVIFYLLTNKGLYEGHDSMRNFENQSSPWLELFNDGNKVVTEFSTLNK